MRWKFTTISLPVPNLLLAVCAGIILLLAGAYYLAEDAQQRYTLLVSKIMYDRVDQPIHVAINSKEHYVLPATKLPDAFESYLLTKEDRYYYFHFGINPLSTLRAIHRYITEGNPGGSSTITQQLAKNLLGTELKRSLPNKMIELLYTLSMELYLTKAEILEMYSNTVYLGNQVQGFETASQVYFKKPLIETTFSEQISLLATLAYPNERNPWNESNVKYASALAEQIDSTLEYYPPDATDGYSLQSPALFELTSAGISCEMSCQTTIDAELTEALRTILKRHIEAGWDRNIRNGAVVVINPTTSELLALVGTRDPYSELEGDQINMALAPRPIGSTVKPFIYAAGFSQGLRPYTTVEDREYKYPIATGEALYPKNYDGLYRGTVTLHEALSNSLNVPSVKVLEYLGLEHFYSLLRDTMQFVPLQELDTYQYGIALGGLEMDLLTLTHYFSIFPRGGTIAPLRVLTDESENFNLPPQSEIGAEVRIFESPHIGLVHAVLSDRLTGVEQFGLVSNLNIPAREYGVKTGTSRDFHDSWVVGYTPTVVVGVWLGNSSNEPLEQVSGQTGAGAVWNEVMNYLINTRYYSDKMFEPIELVQFPIEGSNEWGLPDDKVSEHRSLLSQNNLILSIYPGDNFALTNNISIPLRARKEVEWRVDGEFLATAKETFFRPTQPGRYEISATDVDQNNREYVSIEITELE